MEIAKWQENDGGSYSSRLDPGWQLGGAHNENEKETSWQLPLSFYLIRPHVHTVLHVLTHYFHHNCFKLDVIVPILLIRKPNAERLSNYLKVKKDSNTQSSGALWPPSSFMQFLGGFPGGAVVKNPPATAGDESLIPGSGRSPGIGIGNPLQYSCR